MVRDACFAETPHPTIEVVDATPGVDQQSSSSFMRRISMSSSCGDSHCVQRIVGKHNARNHVRRGKRGSNLAWLLRAVRHHCEVHQEVRELRVPLVLLLGDREEMLPGGTKCVTRIA